MKKNKIQIKKNVPAIKPSNNISGIFSSIHLSIEGAPLSGKRYLNTAFSENSGNISEGGIFGAVATAPLQLLNTKVLGLLES